MPQPRSLEIKDGYFSLNEETSIICSAEGRAEALLLQSYLAGAVGFELPVLTDTAAQGNAIRLEIDPAVENLNEEGYRLVVNSKAVVISAATPAGLFYGIQTLRQLLPSEIFSSRAVSRSWKVPGVAIEDEPSYPWRGMMLDVSRYFLEKDYVKRYIDIMAMHKLNVLHLHLVDDPGWRIEIEKYPKLTEIGGFRDEGAKRHGGFYSKDDVREIVAYAAERHVQIVPEIELPAHVQSALASYPWLGCTGKQLEMPVTCYISREIYCAGKETTYQFLEDVLSEVVELFPFEYIHIGGDEAKYDRWKECPDCKKMLAEQGLADFGDLQGYMTRRIEKFLLGKNRKIIGWDEITNMSLTTNAAVMTWHRPRTAAQAARAGNTAVMALTGHAYFDTPESKLPGEPPAATWLAPISLEKAYNWEPAPAELNDLEKKRILGAHGCMWTDRFMHNPILQDLPALNESRSYRYMEYLSLPRMAALAEVVWTPQPQRSWDNFTQRMAVQYNRYSSRGYNFRVPLPIAEKPVKVDDGYQISLICPVGNARICYSTDGNYPSVYSAVYTGPIVVDDPQKFRAVTVVDERHLSLVFAFPQDPAGRFAKFGTLLGKWESGKIAAGEYKSVDFDGSGKINKDGAYEVTFIYTGGEQRLDINKVEVILHGQVVAQDTHYGTAGGAHKDNTYKVEIQNFETGATYTVRAYVMGDTGSDSNGMVLIKKAE